VAFTLRTRLAPPGQHRAVLASIEETTGKFGGPAYRWVFTVKGGPNDGTELVKVTGTEARLGSSLGDLLQQLYHRELRQGETVDPVADLIGKEFLVFAVPGNDGSGAVIQTIRPAAQG
jgi:hypothetical protein